MHLLIIENDILCPLIIIHSFFQFLFQCGELICPIFYITLSNVCVAMTYVCSVVRFMLHEQN